MKVDVVVTPKLTKSITCAKFREVNGCLMFYSDMRMGNPICGFKKWIRFFVTEQNIPTPTANKKEK